MDLRRSLLIAAMAVVGYFLMINWQKDYGDKPEPVAVATSTATVNAEKTDIPTAAATTDIPVSNAAKTDVPTTTNTSVNNAELISVTTDVLDIKIDPVGGDVVYAALPKFAVKARHKQPFVLLDNSNSLYYVAKSGLAGKDGVDADPSGRPQYQSESKQFTLAESDKNLKVILTVTQKSGAVVRKVYEFERGNYAIKMHYEIDNKSDKVWDGFSYGQLIRDNSKDPSSDQQGIGMSTFLGAAWWTEKKPYNKVNLDEFTETAVNETLKGGWIALAQHYFLSVWIPDSKSTNTYTTGVLPNKHNFVRYVTADIQIKAGEEKALAVNTLYLGPKDQKVLETLSPGLDLTIDYGILWFIAVALFKLMHLIYDYIVPNWGWAIIILTIIVKAAFFHLSATSYKSMANMRRVTPKIQQIREQHGSDRAKMSQAMMDLYKTEKINPLSGCLPILVQMPVFMALYWVLMEAVELRHAPWMLWIHDLSAMDPYFILPLIMGASMFIQQKLNPAPTDPMQAKIMQFMPVIFTVMFLFFPSGLVLYWVVNNVLGIAQQWYITKQVENGEK
jgi:YidC/Oxa1 family membrane protein insertase